MDDDRAGEILDRRRERPLVTIRTLYWSSFSARSIQLTLLPGDGLVVRVGDEVERVDDIVGVEFLAVVELDALAQLEFERLVVDPFPGGRELALVFVGLGVAVDQRVPDVVAEDHADAHVVEVGIDVLQHLVVAEADRVVLLAGERGCCDD